MAKMPEVYTHSAGRLSLPQFQMFGFVLMALGGYLLFQSNWFGVVAIVVGAALFFAVVGIQIDFKKFLIREFFGIAGIKYGKWKKLPSVDYVTVFIENYNQRGSVASIDSNFKDSKVKVSLIISEKERYDAGFFNSKEKALTTGTIMAKKLNTKMLDYTGKEPK